MHSAPLLVFFGKIEPRAVRQGVALSGSRSAIFPDNFWPYNSDFGIVPGKSALVVRMIKIVAFIAKFRNIAQNQKSMCKPLGDQKLFFVLCRKNNSIPFSESL